MTDQETISISITKNQSNTAMEVSNAVKETIETLTADDSDLTIEIVNDSADTILDSLKDVAVTMILAVVISMIIIFLFFGDVKASLIVGSSIPTSILVIADRDYLGRLFAECHHHERIDPGSWNDGR